ncbi:MAG: hypothetical protein WA231_15340 [Methylocella sp.]
MASFPNVARAIPARPSYMGGKLEKRKGCCARTIGAIAGQGYGVLFCDMGTALARQLIPVASSRN